MQNPFFFYRNMENDNGSAFISILCLQVGSKWDIQWKPVDVNVAYTIFYCLSAAFVMKKLLTNF